MKKALTLIVVSAVLAVCLSGTEAAFSGRRSVRPAPLNGGEVWVARYDGPKHDEDWPNAIAVDGSGNVYVTGGSLSGANQWDYATIKYSADGTKKWVRTYQYNSSAALGSRKDYATALALDASGNVYVTGESAEEDGTGRFATIKYSPGGIKRWVARTAFSFFWSQSAATALAVDGAGNVIVTGWRMIIPSASTTRRDIATVKITPEGGTAWTRTSNGAWSGNDEGVAVGIDSARNVYVAGFETGIASGKDFRMIKYSPGGAILWTKAYRGPGGGDDVPAALRIVLRRSGLKILTELAVAGYSKSTATGVDAVTTVLKSDGTTRWTRTFEAPALDTKVRAKAVTSDSSGNVYIAAAGDCGGFYVLKYDASGNVVWKQNYNGGLGADYPTAIVLDASRNVYVTGLSQIGGNSYDFITLKYDTAGNHKWEARYDGPAHGYDWARAIAVDNAGYVYVTGYSEGSGTKTDYVTIKYRPD